MVRESLWVNVRNTLSFFFFSFSFGSWNGPDDSWSMQLRTAKSRKDDALLYGTYTPSVIHLS